MKLILRSLIFAHRWVGIALCVVFLLWFPSGIGMMYWTFPEVTAQDRLNHSPRLDPDKIALSPLEAAARAGVQANPTQVRLNSFDGRPVYRIGGGGRGGGGARIVYADTGEEQTEVSPEMLDRIASAWARQPAADATKESVLEADQWTVAGQLSNLRPMYKYSWPDGQQVYLNGNTGEVVQYTTFGKRLAAHVSAIPHWVYYTPIRKHQPVWLRFMIWSSLIGTAGAIVGMLVAVWMYSPKKRYRLDGQPTGIPYRGQKRWHWILGMVFGVATVTWTFSGLMSLGPFPIVQRLAGLQPQPRAQQQTPQNQQAQQPEQNGPAAQQSVEATPGAASGERRGGQGQRAGGQRRGNTTSGEQRGATAGTGSGRGSQPAAGGGGRGGGQQGVAAALRGRVRMDDFATVHPRELLAKVPKLDVKELEWTSFASTPLFSANLDGGKSQLLSPDGTPVDGFNHDQLLDIVKSAVPDPAKLEVRLLEQYDLYYLDRTRQRPLPVLLVLTHDADETRYYIDPKSARVVGTYSNRNWVSRWLYTGLHSLNFPFLYNNRPLWDIVVITFMVGGTALCVTSLVLAWRTLGRKLRRAAANDVLPRAT